MSVILLIIHSVRDWNNHYFVDIPDYKCCHISLCAYEAICFPFSWLQQTSMWRSYEQFNQKSYSYKSPSRHGIPPHLTGSQILMGTISAPCFRPPPRFVLLSFPFPVIWFFWLWYRYAAGLAVSRRRLS